MVSGPGGQAGAQEDGDPQGGAKRRRTDAPAAPPHGSDGGNGASGAAGVQAAGAPHWAPAIETGPSATALQPDAGAREWVNKPPDHLLCELCHTVFTGEVRLLGASLARCWAGVETQAVPRGLPQLLHLVSHPPHARRTCLSLVCTHCCRTHPAGGRRELRPRVLLALLGALRHGRDTRLVPQTRLPGAAQHRQVCPPGCAAPAPRIGAATRRDGHKT